MQATLTRAGTSFVLAAALYAWRRTRVGGADLRTAFIKNLGPVEPYVFAPATV